jgi:hypothetical protein
MYCEKCHLALTIGDWPYCPHGRAALVTVPDDIPGGVVVENYGPHPMRFDSHSERRRYMKQHGLRETERFAPLPGTDRDPQGIPNPNGYRDLSAAAIIRRNGSRSSSEGSDKDALAGGAPLDPTDKYDIPNTPGERYGIEQFNYAQDLKRP